MIGYDPLHTDTKLDFIHSLIHTLIHLFTLSLGGPLTVCLFEFGVKNFLPSSGRPANGCFKLTLHLLTLQKTNIIDIDRVWGSGESFEIRSQVDPNSPDEGDHLGLVEKLST